METFGVLARCGSAAAKTHPDPRWTSKEIGWIASTNLERLRFALPNAASSGHPVSVGTRGLDLLLALIERRDRVVTKDELLSVVWPGLVVEETNIKVQVSALRKIIGSDVVSTIPGHGYRFVAALA